MDECHRSIYNVWRQVLEYFDAFLIGLTATPSAQTIGFFGGNLVMEYTHEQAVLDGVNVGYDVYRIETQVSKDGATLAKQPGFFVPRRDRKSRKKRLAELDDDVLYAPNQLDRDVVNESQIRLVIRTFRDKLPEMFKDKRLAAFLHLASIAPGFGKTRLEQMVYGLGRPVLNLDNIRDLELPVAPLAEGATVVARTCLLRLPLHPLRSAVGSAPRCSVCPISLVPERRQIVSSDSTLDSVAFTGFQRIFEIPAAPGAAACSHARSGGEMGETAARVAAVISRNAKVAGLSDTAYFREIMGGRAPRITEPRRGWGRRRPPRPPIPQRARS